MVSIYDSTIHCWFFFIVLYEGLRSNVYHVLVKFCVFILIKVVKHSAPPVVLLSVWIKS